MSKEDFTELMAEMLKRQDRHEELLTKLVEGQMSMIKEQAKTNAQLKSLNLSVMKLAEQAGKFTEHESRIERLEKAVFKQ